jgi:hypothetical protein
MPILLYITMWSCMLAMTSAFSPTDPTGQSAEQAESRARLR